MGEENLMFFPFIFFPPPRPAPETDLVIPGIFLPLPFLDSQPCPWCPAAKVFMDNLPNWTRAMCFSGSPFPPASSESLARSNPVSMPGRNSGAVEGERLWVHWTQWPTSGKIIGGANWERRIHQCPWEVWHRQPGILVDLKYSQAWLSCKGS